jgi:hypothetical protein
VKFTIDLHLVKLWLEEMCSFDQLWTRVSCKSQLPVEKKEREVSLMKTTLWNMFHLNSITLSAQCCSSVVGFRTELNLLLTISIQNFSGLCASKIYKIVMFQKIVHVKAYKLSIVQRQ